MTSRPRYASRTDANHAEIRDGLRATGLFLVADISSDNSSLGDLLVKFLEADETGRKRLELLEIKDGKKVPSARKLTPTQQASIDEGWGIIEVDSLDDALEKLGIGGV